jgi:hypothetical protein
MDAVASNAPALAEVQPLDAERLRSDFVFTGPPPARRRRRRALRRPLRHDARDRVSAGAGLVRDGLLEWSERSAALSPQGLRFAIRRSRVRLSRRSYRVGAAGMAIDAGDPDALVPEPMRRQDRGEPFVTIWESPRETIRRVVATDPRRWVNLLFFASGFFGT